MTQKIPHSWETKPFESCLEKITYTTKIQRKDFLESGDFPVISQESEFINGYWNNGNDLFKIKKPVVIFGDHTQVLKYVDFDFVLGADGVKILQPKDFLDTKFLYYFLQSVDLGSLGYARHYRLLKEIQIPLPSLPEQLRFVSILDEALGKLDQAKENIEKNLQNAEKVFDTYLLGILTNPKYNIKMLGDLCEDVEYGSSSKSKSTGKIPVLRMGNIQDGRFDWGKLMYSDDEKEIEKYSLKFNDVLFNRTNSPELVGKTAIYKGEMPAIFAGYLIRINRKEDLLDAEYLTYFLNSSIAKDYGNTVVISSVNQANINGTKLKNYPIPTPTLSEQLSIVSQLDTLSIQTKRLEAIYQQKLAHLDELRKSLLQKAFNGEL